MRAFRSNGRTGTPVIPAGWGESHAVVLVGTRTAIVSLTDGSAQPVPGDWDPDTESYGEGTPAEPYASSVAASIVAQTTTGDPRVEAAGEVLDRFDFLVGVDHGQDAWEGDLVKVTDCPGDLLLVGRSLTVERVGMDAERFERLLYCTLSDDREDAPA